MMKYFLLIIALGVSVATAAETITVPVIAANKAPTIDGSGADWADQPWIDVMIEPAMENDESNQVGTINVHLKARVVADRFYLLARWNDDAEDRRYKDWEWFGNAYRRGKRVDDMFAVRFDMEGDYDSCMITNKNYKVDVWLWSAGRSDQVGYAEDMWHLITQDLLENAAEYEGPNGKTVYIRKRSDEGDNLVSNRRIDRRTKTEKRVQSIDFNENPSGSIADVKAKGVWSDGYWTLEMSRAMDTGHSDDRAFVSGEKLLGAVAVFDKVHSEHKSVSGDLLFDFSNVK